MARAAKKPSWRRRASWRLADLRRLSSVLRSNGEILDQNRWLDVLANTLGSAPEGPVTTRRGPDAPEVWRLDYLNLAVEAQRCGIVATREQIEEAVKRALALREEAARGRAGRLLPMHPDEIARRLGVPAAIRREAEAWTLGATDETPADRKEARRENARIREAARRRAKGAPPKPESSIAQTEPWKSEGISRATWYRRRREGHNETAACAPNDGETAACETAACAANKVRLPRVRLPRAQPIAQRETAACAANIVDKATAAFAARGQRRKAPPDAKAVRGSPEDDNQPPVFRPTAPPDRKIANKHRRRRSPRPEYHHPPGGLGMMAAALVRRPTATPATDQQAAAEPEPAADGEPGAACASPTESPLPASPTGDGGSGAAYASQPESPAFVSAALHENVSEVARCDFGHSAVAEDIHRQLANLVGLPGGLKARRDPPAVIGPTDRFCASCGDYASNEWPIGDGRHEWRCPDCEPPLTAPRHVEVGLAARAARSAA